MIHLYEAVQAKDQTERKLLEDMQTSITAFSRFTTIPITFFSPSFEMLWEMNRTSKFCITNASYENPCSRCRKTLTEAMKRSTQRLDSSTFICATGLINIVLAFHLKGRLAGYFIAGPVAMGKDPSKAISEFYAKVQEETIDMPLLMTMTNNLNVYSPYDVENLARIFQDILRQYNSEGSENDPGAGQLPFTPDPVINYQGNSDVIYNAIAYIQEHFRTITNLSEVAGYVHVSRSYLSSLFRKETGISIIEYFQRIRLQAAEWELRNTDKNITAVALSVGFRESSYFSKLFSEQHGITPTEFRKQK